MNEKYRRPEDILKTLDPGSMPIVGPAMCDAAEGDENYNIPADLNDYYLPLYKEKYFIPGSKKQFFFGELQPEASFLLPSGEENVECGWYSYSPGGTDAWFGLHFPVKSAFAGTLSEDEYKHTIRTREKVIDLGERIGVKYYIIHVSQDGFIGTDSHFQSASRLLEETIAYLSRKKSRAHILIENLEYPKYPSTPGELVWWVEKAKEYDQGKKLNIGAAVDIAHLWKSRGDIIRNISEGKNLPGWIMEEKDIICQPFHDLLNYTLTVKLEGIEVPVFHLGGCWGHETHLIPGMRMNENPELTDININRFYDENIEMNQKDAIKSMVSLSLDRHLKKRRITAKELEPVYIVTEAYVSHYNNSRNRLKYPSVMKGVIAVRDYLAQYLDRLRLKSENRIRIYNLMKNK